MTPVTAFEKEIESLSSRLDEISTSILVSGHDNLSSEALRSLAQDAQKIGFLDAAKMAEALASSCPANAAESQPADVLKGLTDLRALLEKGPQDPAPRQSPKETASCTPVDNSSESSFAEDPELVSDFLMESREHLSSIESQMLTLEKAPDSKEVIHAVFRTFHTIKGLAGFLAFNSIVELAHDVETLLDLARKDSIKITPPIVDVVLESADYLKNELDRIEQQLTGASGTHPAENGALRVRIANLSKPGHEGDAVVPEKHGVQPPAAKPQEPAEVLSASENSFPQLADGTGSTAPVASESGKSSDNGSVRVETTKLDHLLEMVGEMVIAQSLLRNHPAFSSATDQRLLANLGQLTRSTDEIQRATMSMRMVPIGQVFQRSARLVRDLSRKYQKQVVFEVFGEDTEVDKTIAEELSDPLLHMVRNSIDHGVESPEERIAAGKTAEARICFKAYHRAGQIVIEISDDGRGLNREKILAKAIQNGLASPDAQLSDNEIYQLIFEPGFSTSEKVSDVSGRGVGMDVVRRNMQKLRGRIDIESIAGHGTTFFLRLPLTLAIIDGLVIMVGETRYVIPVFAVREMLRPADEMLSTVQGKGEMALVRGRLLPVVRLHARFGVAAKTTDLTKGLLVIVESMNRQFCLFVDDLIGKQEIVIKSLGSTFKDVSGLAGCAVLGDGQIGLILDIDGVFRGETR